VGKKRKTLGVRAVLTAAGARCSECDSKENLDIHHIIDLAKGGTNDPSNLKVVCKMCHDKIHNTIPKKKLRISCIPSLSYVTSYRA
jgi:5-methylcytosine-specific restriction endonuclease McrA